MKTQYDKRVKLGKAWVENYLNSLCHHGIKGQKHGVRNGPPYPLTQEAKERAYGDSTSNNSKKKLTKDYRIHDPSTGDVYHMVEGTKLRNQQTFAGKGTKYPLKEEVAEGLAEQIGGKPENWKHRKGNATIDDHGEEREAEVHWFEEESVGKHKFKIKEWKD